MPIPGIFIDNVFNTNDKAIKEAKIETIKIDLNVFIGLIGNKKIKK